MFDSFNTIALCVCLNSGSDRTNGMCIIYVRTSAAIRRRVLGWNFTSFSFHFLFQLNAAVSWLRSNGHGQQVKSVPGIDNRCHIFNWMVNRLPHRSKATYRIRNCGFFFLLFKKVSVSTEIVISHCVDNKFRAYSKEVELWLLYRRRNFLRLMNVLLKYCSAIAPISGYWIVWVKENIAKAESSHRNGIYAIINHRIITWKHSSDWISPKSQKKQICGIGCSAITLCLS